MNSIFNLGILSSVTIMNLSLFNPDNAYASDEIWSKLVEGGKVVLMRHSSLNIGRGSGNSLIRDSSCKKERNLSSEGEKEARTIGQRFSERKIPIAEVRSSPFCRTADTAKIAFGNTIPVEYLSLSEILSSEEAAAQSAQLSQIIGSYAGKGNLVLVTHEPNINAVSFETMKHSDFLVLQPKGGVQFDELGIVSFSESK